MVMANFGHLVAFKKAVLGWHKAENMRRSLTTADFAESVLVSTFKMTQCHASLRGCATPFIRD